ncbi:MAG: trypsin-like peptidase domain-containing protein [Planctomycetaceae bacterium]|nr:trypsin-like peptidase domain-containing protein [Planctomycetaceae bacterium]
MAFVLAGKPARRSRFVAARWLVLVAVGVLTLSEIGRASERRNSPLARAYKRVGPTVVDIHGEKLLSPDEMPLGGNEADRHVNGMGTGAIVDERGYIITNHHVVDGVEKIHVTLHSGKSYVAKLISHDPSTDLAIIKIDAAESLPVTPVGTSSDLMPGEDVMAIGNAFGYEHTVTQGIISALHRTVQVGDTQRYEDLIQTDASINPGNSGGPLFNIDGEMIGINVAVRVGAQGIGFAIPIDKAMEIAADLLSTRRVSRAWHGVVAKPAHDGNLALIVDRLEADAPAKASGLAEGDRIKMVNGKPVVRQVDFERALIGQAPGDKVSVIVERDQKEVKLELALAPVPKHMLPAGDPAWEVLGLRLATIPSKQFQRYRSRYHGGLLVTAVRPESPAARQGIARGDVLVGMHIWETITPDNVSYILNRPDFADLHPLKFYILRGTETWSGHLPSTTSKR